MEIKRIKSEESFLVVDLFNDYRMFYGQPHDKILAGNFINARLEKNESVIFAALNGQNMAVGFTQLYPVYSSVRASKNWILNDLFVDASHRKQGVGEALIKAAMAYARSQQASFLQLETANDNYTAQSLYETLGFKKQQPNSGYILYQIDI